MKNRLIIIISILSAYIFSATVAISKSSHADEIKLWCNTAYDIKPIKSKPLSGIKINDQLKAITLLIRNEEWNEAKSSIRYLRARLKKNQYVLTDRAEGMSYYDKMDLPLDDKLIHYSVLVDIKTNDFKRALHEACKLLTQLTTEFHQNGRDGRLKYAIHKFGRAMSSAGLHGYKEILNKYALELTTGSVPARCIPTFIERWLCEELIESLVSQGKLSESSQHIVNWLGAVGNDVGVLNEHYLRRVRKAIDILNLHPDKLLLDALSHHFARVSSDALNQARNLDPIRELGSISSEYSKAHMEVATAAAELGRDDLSAQHYRDGARWMISAAVTFREYPFLREMIRPSLEIAGFFADRARQPAFAAVVEEWRMRRRLNHLMPAASNSGTMMRLSVDDRGGGAAWMNFSRGFPKLDAIIRETEFNGDHDLLLIAAALAAAADIDELQGPYKSEAINSYATISRYLAWVGDRSRSLEVGDIVIERVQDLSKLDVSGWETWLSQRMAWSAFFEWFRAIAIEESNSANSSTQDSRSNLDRIIAANQFLQQSRASWALSATTSRTKTNDPDLDALLQSHAALIDEAVSIEACLHGGGFCTRLFNYYSEPDSHERHMEFHARRDDALAKLGAISDQVRVKLPDFGKSPSIGRPSLSDVRNVIHEDEAILLLDLSADAGAIIGIGKNEKSTYSRVINKDEAIKINEKIQKLRCGVDISAWESDSGSKCKVNAGKYFEKGHVLPFSLVTAYDLYKLILGGSDFLLNARKLIVQSSGQFSDLPISLLVTQAPDADIPAYDQMELYQRSSWLGLSKPIARIASLETFIAARKSAKPSQATPGRRRYLGIGNPLLEGDGSTRQKIAASETGNRQACMGWNMKASAETARLVALEQVYRGGVDGVRSLAPLPGTAEEICSAAANFGAEAEDVLLGERASEARIKSLSDAGDLAQFEVVHFATHALLASEAQTRSAGIADPALVLTPPSVATSDNDGLLTASEIAALRLNADWIILSACNTGAGDGSVSDALSGLARAFFTAGARSLLVSHWFADNEASKIIVTTALKSYLQEPGSGRSVALMKAMRAVAQGADPLGSHPTFWSVFSIVAAE